MQSAPQYPVPVFPLPGTVLFPHTTLPLHVFELRYRTMVRDALSLGRTIAVALLKPGWEQDYYGSPEFHPLGCLARVEDVEWLPNDSYELRVAGFVRVRFTRVVREFPYRAAQVDVLPQLPYPEDDPLVVFEKTALCDTFDRLLEALGVASAEARVDRTMSYEALVNMLCAGADLSPAERLELLALDSVIERGSRIRELTETQLSQGVGGSARRREPGAPAEGGEQN